MSSKFSDLRLLVAVVWCRMNVLQGYYTDDTYGGGVFQNNKCIIHKEKTNYI